MLLESFRIITKTSSFLGARILRFHGSGLCKVFVTISVHGTNEQRVYYCSVPHLWGGCLMQDICIAPFSLDRSCSSSALA